MEYISASSVTESDSGGEAELKLWNRLKRCFDDNDLGVLYHQYPIINKGGDGFDRKPDFVLLHDEMGLVILECKGYTAGVRPLLRVDATSTEAVRSIAKNVRQFGQPDSYTCYNVDFTRQLRFCLETDAPAGPDRSVCDLRTLSFDFPSHE